MLPIIFGLVALCFIPLARPLGGLLTQVRPLTAYTFDILGSLSGTAAFFLIAYFSLPPVVWFAALAALVIALSDRRMILLATVAMLACAGVAWQLQEGTYWSPYYKIVLHQAEPRGWIVDVNNAGGHQLMAPWQDKEPFYRRVYDIFPGPSFQHALILGAGSGSDVATALAKGVPDVTARGDRPEDRGARRAVPPRPAVQRPARARGHRRRARVPAQHAGRSTT